MSEVRRAREDDAEAIARIHVGAWRWAYRGLLPDELLDGLDVTERAEARRRGIAEPGTTRTWVVEDEGAVRGFAVTGASRDADLQGDAPTRELFALYVEPDRVGRGLGRPLLERALADAREAGAPELTLWVLVGNRRGRSFCERAGFALDARVGERGCIKDQGCAVRLRRSLPTPEP